MASLTTGGRADSRRPRASSARPDPRVEPGEPESWYVPLPSPVAAVSPTVLARLHRQIGNRATGQLLRRMIGKPEDHPMFETFLHEMEERYKRGEPTEAFEEWLKGLRGRGEARALGQASEEFLAHRGAGAAAKGGSAISREAGQKALRGAFMRLAEKGGSKEAAGVFARFLEKYGAREAARHVGSLALAEIPPVEAAAQVVDVTLDVVDVVSFVRDLSSAL
jgi:hypothetical protein